MNDLTAQSVAHTIVQHQSPIASREVVTYTHELNKSNNSGSGFGLVSYFMSYIVGGRGRIVAGCHPFRLMYINMKGLL